MKLSKYYLPTLKEAPKDADTLSAKLMLRAGLIRKTASGIYEWLPLGLKILKKVEQIVREEMNAAGSNEVWLPLIQPKELWEESGRWNYYGKELLRIKDRKGAEFCFAPTAEEVITNLVRRDVTSYKQLPVSLYQFASKFRDEIRPRFGVMRAREFYMKDAYSFHADEESIDAHYKEIYAAYVKIFTRCGFKFKPVEADTGAIGGNFSHEFMVLADTGENAIADCPLCGYAANTEKAEIMPAVYQAATDLKQTEKVNTPGAHSVEDVAKMLGRKPEDLIKLLVFVADDKPVAVLMRGDHELNEFKLKSLLKANRLEKANEETYVKFTGSPVGFAGPGGLKEKGVKLLADYHVRGVVNGVAGGNEKDVHTINVNPGRDFEAEYADLKIAAPGDACGKCGGKFTFTRGIEVGHTFKLGTKYSESMKAEFLDENQKSKPFIMGCYGIGISRVVAAAIEQSHDANGIIWPAPLAPFDVYLASVDADINPKVKEAAEDVYEKLTAAGYDVLYDDRAERPGVKFKDADLIGLPHRIVVSTRTLEQNECEYKPRASKDFTRWSLLELVKKMNEAAGK